MAIDRKLTFKGHRQECLKKLRLLAKSKGGVLLSTDYTNNKGKLKWRCKMGHVWQAIPTSITRGHWCLICGNEQQGKAKAHSIEMMQKFASKKGGKCLSKIYKNNLTKLRWRCKYGHEWEAVPGSIFVSKDRKGSWCPICAGRLTKPDALKAFAKLAKSRKGKLISKKYKDAKSKLHFKCEKGHEWKAVADSVKRGGWCPVCAGSQPLSLKEMHIAAASYGGKCLSKNYLNIDAHLKWQCAAGHEWFAKPYHVRTGHWCPICSQGVSERICRAIVEQITGVKFPKIRPPWLKNSRGNQMELDGFAEDLKIAFEYHGMQHYKEVKFFHRGKDRFDLRKKDDIKKRKLCQKHNVALIEIPHDILHVDLQSFLVKKLREINSNKDLILNNNAIDIRKLDVWDQKQIEEMQKIAKERGGYCLSDFYINNNTKLRWRCSKDHEWEAVSSSIKMGTWCSKCGNQESAKKRAHTIEDMKNIAVARGGECLSSIYKSSKDRLRWRCIKGHEWEATANPVIKGHWCPKCGFEKLARLFALSIDDMRDTAKKNGGECLSTEYKNTKSKLRWRCKYEHEWEAVPASFRNGTWCPYCAFPNKTKI